MRTPKIDNLTFNSIDPVFYPPFCWNKLYNKDFLIRNNLKFMNTKTSNDVAFVFLSLVLANKIEIVRKILIKYIQREFSLTRTRSIDNFSDVEVYKFIKKELKKRKMFNQVKHLYYQLMYKSYSDALNLSADANKNQLYAKIKTYLPPEFFIYLKKYATYKELKKFIKLKFYPFSFILIGVYKQILQFFTHKKTKSNNLEN